MDDTLRMRPAFPVTDKEEMAQAWVVVITHFLFWTFFLGLGVYAVLRVDKCDDLALRCEDIQARLKDREADIEGLLHSNRSLTTDNEALEQANNDLTTSKRDFESVNDELQARISDLEEYKTDLERRNEDIERENINWRNTLHALRSPTLDMINVATMRNLEAKCADLQSERDNLQAQVDGAEAFMVKVTELEASHKRILDANQILNDNLDYVHRMSAHNACLATTKENELRSSEAKVADLKEELDDLKDELADTAYDLEDLQHENDMLRWEIEHREKEREREALKASSLEWAEYVAGENGKHAQWEYMWWDWWVDETLGEDSADVWGLAEEEDDSLEDFEVLELEDADSTDEVGNSDSKEELTSCFP